MDRVIAVSKIRRPSVSGFVAKDIQKAAEDISVIMNINIIYSYGD